MRQVALGFSALSLAGLAFLMTVIWGTPLLRILRHFKMGKIVRSEEPTHHAFKMGTPTMGGVMFIVPVLLLTALLNAVDILGLAQSGLGRSILVPMIVMVGYGVLGAIDDWQGLRGSTKGSGMRTRTKLIGQVVLAVITAFALKYILGLPDMYVPGVKGYFDLGWWYIPLATLIIVGMSNAVNFSDGLDGLAGLIAASAFAGYGIIALSQGQFYLARYCFTIVGALFGFLWFNVHPASLIMGDTGSLALGAGLGVIALMTSDWLVLPLIAIIPASEMLSVVIQILYFRATNGRRFFKMAPIHLHFELLGWSETQVVQRFWLIGLMGAMIGVGLALV